jgi:mycofactocin precursor
MTERAVAEVLPAEVAPAKPGQAADALVARAPAGGEALIADELLVEEVSIDGMCGVY